MSRFIGSWLNRVNDYNVEFFQTLIFTRGNDVVLQPCLNRIKLGTSVLSVPMTLYEFWEFRVEPLHHYYSSSLSSCRFVCYFYLCQLRLAVMVERCCVMKCRSASHDDQGEKINNGISFHPFPVWRQNEGSDVSELTKTSDGLAVSCRDEKHILRRHPAIHKSVLCAFPCGLVLCSSTSSHTETQPCCRDRLTLITHSYSLI